MSSAEDVGLLLGHSTWLWVCHLLAQRVMMMITWLLLHMCILGLLHLLAMQRRLLKGAIFVCMV